MTTQNIDRIHRAVSDDGTEIVGRVYGQGPPLVLVHGSMDDGADWDAALPLLIDRFTCYVPSTRFRGLSGRHPDLSTERRVQDVTAFADSIGEPAGLAGLSAGGTLVLGAAARARAVSAVAVYEPLAIEVMTDQFRAGFQDRLLRMSEAAARGKPVDAAQIFIELVSNDEEFAAVTEVGGVEQAARYLPIDLQEFRQYVNGHSPSPTDPRVLEQVTAPVLLLSGTRSAQTWFTDSVHHVARHIPDAGVREIAGAGHLGSLTAPESVAGELARFFERAAQLTGGPTR